MIKHDRLLMSATDVGIGIGALYATGLTPLIPSFYKGANRGQQKGKEWL